MLLGTAGYMSPEQARGEAVDARTDLWAFGVVLWEMLTGRRLFGGRTATDTLAGVLRQEIDLDELPAGTPAPLRRLARRCLEREPERRLRDAADARLELEEAIRSPQPVAPARLDVEESPPRSADGSEPPVPIGGLVFHWSWVTDASTGGEWVAVYHWSPAASS